MNQRQLSEARPMADWVGDCKRSERRGAWLFQHRNSDRLEVWYWPCGRMAAGSRLPHRPSPTLPAGRRQAHKLRRRQRTSRPRKAERPCADMGWAEL